MTATKMEIRKRVHSRRNCDVPKFEVNVAEERPTSIETSFKTANDDQEDYGEDCEEDNEEDYGEELSPTQRKIPVVCDLRKHAKPLNPEIAELPKVKQDCADGAGSFNELHQQITNAANIDNSKCLEHAVLELPGKSVIEGTVQRAASKLGFNADCTQNRQRDQPIPKLLLKFHDHNDDDIYGKELSPTQRKMVCDLRKGSKQNSEITRLIKVEQDLVDSVRCKQTSQRKDRPASKPALKRPTMTKKTMGKTMRKTMRKTIGKTEEDFGEELSPTQRKMVCDLRKHAKPNREIAELLKVKQD
ncbi:hypothetical protein QZH41_002443 [Actinostola sp. cb2023]|nr:hypothetical protein QZH41_002443 [Actinostola sp. cb2023]